MADFQGYLLKIEGKILPMKYIQTYTVTPNQVQDMDSYRDVEGVLHREIVTHTPSKIEFTTPYLWLEDKKIFQSFFPSRNQNPKIAVEYWNDEGNDYKIGKFYMPDIQYQIYRVKNNNIQYQPFRVALIEY